MDGWMGPFPTHFHLKSPKHLPCIRGVTVPHQVISLLVTFCKWELSQIAGQDHCQSESKPRSTLWNWLACSVRWWARPFGSITCNVAAVLRTTRSPFSKCPKAAESSWRGTTAPFTAQRMLSLQPLSSLRDCPEQMPCLIYVTKWAGKRNVNIPGKMQVKLHQNLNQKCCGF